MLEETVDAAKSRISGDWNISVVIDHEKIVLGILQFPISAASNKAIEELMEPAPRTLRPSVSSVEAVEYLDQSGLTFALVTKSTGELIGGIRKSDFKNHKHE
jgi:predicted transcriptional regulator